MFLDKKRGENFKEFAVFYVASAVFFVNYDEITGFMIDALKAMGLN